ncbi:MAG: hypothetical protein H8K10_13515 [Nitrospira sp.]|nr:hypothetical protein [Nitrospira sp.]
MDMPLADQKGFLVDSYGNEQFSRDVIARFPTLRGDLERNADLLHPQMDTLAQALRQRVQSGDTHFPMRICSFLDEALRKPKAISEIGNAVAISFVEACELRKTPTGKAVLRMMPTSVRSILLEQERRGGAQ